MKIVLFLSTFPKLSETFIVSKFLGLLDRGFDVFVVCQKFESSAWDAFKELRSRPYLRKRVRTVLPHREKWKVIVLLPFVLIWSLIRRPLVSLRYFYQGWKVFGIDIIRRFYLDEKIILTKPDILHFEFGPLAVGKMYLKESLDCRIVVSFRGYDLSYVGLDSADYYHEIWQKADALHLLGAGLWRRAQQRGCPEDKPHVLIPPAIDVEFFQRSSTSLSVVAGTAERPLRILSVGRLEWIKGYEYALDAVSLLMSKGVHFKFRIIGDGNYLEALAFLRHEHGMEKDVEFLGALPRSEVKLQMEWADVLLHSAVFEGFCNAVIEAQAMALPVVCTDAGGLRENVSDGETAFVVPSRLPSALMEKLALLATNSELRGRMGSAGRKRVLNRYTLEGQISAFQELYQVLSTKKEQQELSGQKVLRKSAEGASIKG